MFFELVSMISQKLIPRFTSNLVDIFSKCPILVVTKIKLVFAKLDLCDLKKQRIFLQKSMFVLVAIIFFTFQYFSFNLVQTIATLIQITQI